MSKLLPIVAVVLFLPGVVTAQIDDDFRKAFYDFRQQSVKEFGDFRQKANAEYADFLQQAWKEFSVSPAIEKPKEKTVPPVKIRPIDEKKPIDDTPVKINEIIAPPPIMPRPEPVAPVKPVEPVGPDSPIETPVIKTGQILTVSLYGTDMTVRVSDEMRFTLKPDEKDVSRVWKRLSGNATDNTVYDCLALRDRYALSDWAYFRLLDVVADKLLGNDSNESELLKAFLYCQSGYQMRLAFAGDRLVMLFASPYTIYGRIWWGIDGMRFYCDFEGLSGLTVCNTSFPGEKPMRTSVTTVQRFGHRLSPERQLVSRKGVSVKSAVNANYIDFCNDFPSSQYGDDPMTRWAIYANTPTSVAMKETLYPQLLDVIGGLSDYEAVDRLCNWVQTAFEYEYDDKVWGADRAFFADETLYYPYCDCEDRSILLTRVVRDLLGLRCALVYYPGHLATAIALGEDAKGDYIRMGGEKFLVCDPTYINAPIGRTIPGMDNQRASVMVLE